MSTAVDGKSEDIEKLREEDKAALYSIQSQIFNNTVDLLDADGDRRIVKSGPLKRLNKGTVVFSRFSPVQALLCNDCFLWANKKGVVQQIFRLESFLRVGNILGVGGFKHGFQITTEYGGKLLFETASDEDKKEWLEAFGHAIVEATQITGSTPIDGAYFAKMIRKLVPAKRFPISSRYGGEFKMTDEDRKKVFNDSAIHPEEMMHGDMASAEEDLLSPASPASPASLASPTAFASPTSGAGSAFTFGIADSRSSGYSTGSAYTASTSGYPADYGATGYGSSGYGTGAASYGYGSAGYGTASYGSAGYGATSPTAAYGASATTAAAAPPTGYPVDGAPGWIAKQDPSSGYWYYENTAGGYWQWDHPLSPPRAS